MKIRIHSKVIARISFVMAVLLAGVSPASGQSMTDVLGFLLTNRSVQTGDFARDEAAARATADTLARALLVDLATLPVGSAGGGFAYRMNPSLGTIERATDTFGPVFTERALTAGRHQLSFGATYDFARFDRLDGLDLRSGALVTTANQFVDEPRPFDVETLKLKIRASTVTLFGNFGVTERLDVGAALPLVSLSIDGERYDTYRSQTFLQARASANRTGPADLAIRGKYRALGYGSTGVSAGVELRVPTGSTDNLLGRGKATVKFLAIGSAEHGRLASHVNAGVVTGGAFGEVDYNGAITFAATDRFTLFGEVAGRRIDAAGHITELVLPHPTIAGVQTIRLVPLGTTLNTAVVMAGAKMNLASTWLLGVHVALPVTNAGLRARPTPIVALDYTFAR